jgi:hypothetical protein
LSATFSGVARFSVVVGLLPDSGPPSPVSVNVDIKPGSYPNSINLCSQGVVTVAILGSAVFDVSTVNLDRLTFGSATPRMVGKANKSSCNYVDVSGDFSATMKGLPDRFVDLVCQYNTFDLGDVGSLQSVSVQGYLLNGFSFKGSDTINIVKDGCVPK